MNYIQTIILRNSKINHESSCASRFLIVTQINTNNSLCPYKDNYLDLRCLCHDLTSRCRCSFRTDQLLETKDFSVQLNKQWIAKIAVHKPDYLYTSSRGGYQNSQT